MNTGTLSNIDSNMDQQLRVLKHLGELIDDCEDRMVFGEASEDDIRHLRGYCADMARAAEVAKKLTAALAPIYKEEDEQKKAEEEKKKKEEAAAKRSEAAKKAAATRKAKEEKKAEEPDEDSSEESGDDDADFLD